MPFRFEKNLASAAGFEPATVVKWSENSVRFVKSYGNWLPDGPNSVRFYLTVCDMACMYLETPTGSILKALGP